MRYCKWRCSNPRCASSTKLIRPRHRCASALPPKARTALRSPDRAMIVITHYQRLLTYIVPDKVHVMARGQLLRSGGKELALGAGRVGICGLWRRSGIRASDDHPSNNDPSCRHARRRNAFSTFTRAPPSQLPGAHDGNVRVCRPRRGARSASRSLEFRTAASRNGNTPICARSCREVLPLGRCWNRSSVQISAWKRRPDTRSRNLDAYRAVFADGVFHPGLSDHPEHRRASRFETATLSLSTVMARIAAASWARFPPRHRDVIAALSDGTSQRDGALLDGPGGHEAGQAACI